MDFEGRRQYIMDPDGISGDSQIAGWENKVDISSFHYAAWTPVDNYEGAGLAGVGNPHVSAVTITKKTCSATPKIESQFFKGKPIPTVVLTAFKLDGEKLNAYMVVTLKNALIQSFECSPEGNETMTLVFTNVKREFFGQDTASDSLASKGSTTFDLKSKTVS